MLICASGAPRHETTLVSRLVTASYWQRQCALWFPTVNGFTYGSAISPDNNVHQVNKHTQGWRLEDTERLIFINGYLKNPFHPLPHIHLQKNINNRKRIRSLENSRPLLGIPTRRATRIDGKTARARHPGRVSLLRSEAEEWGGECRRASGN
jgi:hypothetical protein